MAPNDKGGWKPLVLGAAAVDTLALEQGWFGGQTPPTEALPRGRARCLGIPFHTRWGRWGPCAVRLGRGAEFRRTWRLRAPRGARWIYLLTAGGGSREPMEVLGQLRWKGARGAHAVRSVVLAGSGTPAALARAGTEGMVLIQDWWAAYPVVGTADTRPWLLADVHRPFQRKHCLYVTRLAVPPGAEEMEWRAANGAGGGWMVLAATAWGNAWR